MKYEKNNSGSWNSGDWNSGNRNSGSWNSCNRETGFFNSIESQKIRVFNKECLLEVWETAEKPDFIYFYLQKWISSDKMTEKEKEDNPSHETTGGYLKTYDYKEAFQESYKNATKEDKELLLKLPNFDADVFYEISGIDVTEDDKSNEINDIKAEIEKLQERLNKLEK